MKSVALECWPICTSDGCDRDCRSRSSPFCEAHYYRLRRADQAAANPVIKSCLYCETRLTKGRIKFCSPRCFWRHNQGCPLKRQCAFCGGLYEPIGKRVTCSDECRSAHIRIQNTASYAKRNVCPKRRAVVQAGCARRRLRFKKAVVEVFDPHEVFERDSWKCGICLKQVNRKAKWPSPDSPSLDHIVPIVEGGEHSRRNTQCSHLRCNLRKNAGAGGQLRLLP